MRFRTALFIVAAILLIGPLAGAEDVEQLIKTFADEGDMKARVQAGLDLGSRDPDALATAVDRVVKAGRPEDAVMLATTAVGTKVRHVRLLLVWGASTLGGCSTAFLDKIDNDHPNESMRAIEALGFLKAPDAFDRLMTLARSSDEILAIQATRALGRIGSKKDSKEMAELALEINNAHVRTHMAWALQDAVGSKKSAVAALARYQGKQGTVGFRAKEMVALLEDQLALAEPYKVKLQDVRKFFGVKPNRLVKIDAPTDQLQMLEKAIANIAEKSPAWHHLVTRCIDKIAVTGKMHRFDFRAGEVNVKFGDLIKWNREELIEYYLVRYAAIMFLQKMGDPWDGHRGWEEGFVECWWYAIEHTQVDVEENLRDYVKGRIDAKPW